MNSKSKPVPSKIPGAESRGAGVAGVGNNKVSPAPHSGAAGKHNEGKTKEGAEEDNDSDEESKPGMSAADGASKSLQQRDEDKMKNECQKCCGKIMAFFAHDAIYGSFVGPHPVSFLFFCSLLKKRCPCTQQCSRPLCVASIATKIMNFIMLGVISILAGFFVVPYPEVWLLSFQSTDIANFYPCGSGKMIKYKAANGGCDNHAGYFMAYRCFFAYATAMLVNCVLMLRVSNTKDDPYRSKIHHGFWMYKWIFLIILLTIYFMMVNGERDKEGLFEFVASVIGNIAHVIFSLVEITFVMDLVEIWVYENKTGNGKWSTFIYWTNTFLVFLVSVIIYVKIWVEFSFQRVYLNNGIVVNWPAWPNDNCIEGHKRRPDWRHSGLILASTGLIMLLITVMSFRKVFGFNTRFPYTGWLQTGVMTLVNLSYLWSALTNSSSIHSRPRCNVGLDFFSTPRTTDLKQGVRRGSWDQYFGKAGLFHGIFCVLALLYFAFVHGPRSPTAPLSLLYSYIFRIVDRIPVYPDEENSMPLGFLQAIKQTKVWDDEQSTVAQSWSLFYFMMMTGSLSLMMAMTNFTNPWAADHYNSSNVALFCKFGTAVIATSIYIIMLISQCDCISNYGSKSQRIRKRSVMEVLEFNFDETDEAAPAADEAQTDDKTKQPKQTFNFYVPGRGDRKSENVTLEPTNETEPSNSGGGGSEADATAS